MGGPPLKVAIKDDGRGAQAIAAALRRAGHEIVARGPADLLLIDLDAPIGGYRELIGLYKAHGAKILLYPHGAGPVLVYDNLYEPFEAVDANLTIGSGQVELLRRLDYPRPAHSIGWYLCPQLPFRPRADVRHVVFAPTHPGGDGSLLPLQRDDNAEIYAQLLRGPWQLTVRHLGTLQQNGLWPADGVEFIQGRRDLGYAEIDAADAVVAGAGTYPLLAIARGTPTVIYGQCQPPDYSIEGAELIPLRALPRYADLVRFPMGADAGPLDEVIHAAARDEGPIVDWKRRWIGEPFDGARTVALIEQLVRDGEAAPSLEHFRSRVTVAFAEELRERPELLSAYVRNFDADADATLAVWGPGMPEPQLLALAEAALADAGLDADNLPDVVLVPHGDLPKVDALLAERATAVLGDWPAAGRLGALPRFATRELRAFAA